MKQLFCGLMALGLILVFGIAGQGQGQPSYRFTTLDVPSSSYPEGFYATGINDSGQIVGYYPG
jgi:hypothetical protein